MAKTEEPKTSENEGIHEFVSRARAYVNLES